MILGLTIERGFIDDRYPTYVVCDFDSYPEEENLFGQRFNSARLHQWRICSIIRTLNIIQSEI